MLFNALVAFPRQIRIASPYSRYGLGDLSDVTTMHGTFRWDKSASRSGAPYHINFQNPASYTAFDSVSFVFEGGFPAHDSSPSPPTSRDETRNYASLGYISFGLPVTRWWRTSIRLLPFSDVGYSIADHANIYRIVAM